MNIQSLLPVSWMKLAKQTLWGRLIMQLNNSLQAEGELSTKNIFFILCSICQKVCSYTIYLDSMFWSWMENCSWNQLTCLLCFSSQKWWRSLSILTGTGQSYQLRGMVSVNLSNKQTLIQPVCISCQLQGVWWKAGALSSRVTRYSRVLC